MSYDDLAYFAQQNHAPTILEAYSGSSVVAWYGSIERQIQGMEQQYVAARNQAYADKLHVFLTTWRDHELDGSINIETLETLEAATTQLAADPWKLNNFFSNLRDQLRKLIASAQELPLDAMVQGKGGPSPSSSPDDFGPEKSAAGGQPPSAPATTPATTGT